jgi:hypothetical protein
VAITPEGRIKLRIKQYLRARIGARRDTWYYMPVQSGMGVVGIPDIIACIKGRLIAIETKAPGKRNTVTANQRFQLDGIDRAGGLTLVCDDTEQLYELLEEHGLE